MSEVCGSHFHIGVVVPPESRSAFPLIAIVFNGDHLKAGLCKISPCAMLGAGVTPHFEHTKQDIPMLSFTCVGSLRCAVRVLQCLSVCLMDAGKGRNRG